SLAPAVAGSFVVVNGPLLADRDIFPIPTATPTPTATATPVNPLLGSVTSYKLRKWATGSVARWNPCAAIHYRVNLKYAPPGALTDIKTAVARISSVTGIAFVYDGTTAVIPQRGYGSNATITSYPPVVIAWAKTGTGVGTSNVLTSAALGVGGSSGISWVDGSGVAHAVRSVTGIVVLNAKYNAMPAGFATVRGGARGGVLLHELGHVLGLDHVTDTTQEMNPNAIDRSSYGNGDLAGLRKLGRAAGCIR
ncbi:MAG: hypothetical protein QOH99_770, partial [Frankiaceae bacterium]|nr:hypothetical protein [Frankiaceae bacterium]